LILQTDHNKLKSSLFFQVLTTTKFRKKRSVILQALEISGTIQTV